VSAVQSCLDMMMMMMMRVVILVVAARPIFSSSGLPMLARLVIEYVR